MKCQIVSMSSEYLYLETTRQDLLRQATPVYFKRCIGIQFWTAGGGVQHVNSTDAGNRCIFHCSGESGGKHQTLLMKDKTS